MGLFWLINGKAEVIALNAIFFSDRWRPAMTWSSKSLFSTFLNRDVAEHIISTSTGDRNTISVIRVTSNTTSSVITRHFSTTPSTFYDRYLATVTARTFNFPPPTSTINTTETHTKFFRNFTPIFRRAMLVVCCNCTRRITTFSASEFQTSFAKS